MPVPVLRSIARETGKPLADLEEYWHEARHDAKAKFGDEDGWSPREWAFVTGIVKRRAGMRERRSRTEMIVEAQDIPLVIKRIAFKAGVSAKKAYGAFLKLKKRLVGTKIRSGPIGKDEGSWGEDEWAYAMASLKKVLGVREERSVSRAEQLIEQALHGTSGSAPARTRVVETQRPTRLYERRLLAFSIETDSFSPLRWDVIEAQIRRQVPELEGFDWRLESSSGIIWLPIEARNAPDSVTRVLARWKARLKREAYLDESASKTSAKEEYERIKAWSLTALQGALRKMDYDGPKPTQKEAAIDEIMTLQFGEDWQKDAGLYEDSSHVSRRRPHRVDPKRSRAAKLRYRQNKAKYQKAFKKFRGSAAGKGFYKKLGRFNSLHASEATGWDLIFQGYAGLEADLNLMVTASGPDPDLEDLMALIQQSKADAEADAADGFSPDSEDESLLMDLQALISGLDDEAREAAEML